MPDLPVRFHTRPRGLSGMCSNWSIVVEFSRKGNSGINGYLATVANGIQLGPDGSNWVSRSSHTSDRLKLQILCFIEIDVQWPTRTYSFSALSWHCQWSSGQCVSPTLKTKGSHPGMAGPAKSQSTLCQGLNTPVCKQSSFDHFSFLCLLRNSYQILADKSSRSFLLPKCNQCFWLSMKVRPICIL